ncbi:MAG: hypothetical protein LBM07_02365 [Culturomica sp.]|jgi:hypothetical protein|nr:hypothetical protein [Culturomica sp.]
MGVWHTLVDDVGIYFRALHATPLHAGMFAGIAVGRASLDLRLRKFRLSGKDLCLCELQDAFTQFVVILKYNNIRLS